MPDDNNLTLMVWDNEGEPPVGDWITVLWRDFGTAGRVAEYSIPRRVEENADALRSRYLKWIYDVGVAQMDGENLVDSLTLRPGFSYWWMTLIAEKSYGKTSCLFNAVKMMALEQLANSTSPSNVVLYSRNRRLASTLRAWCGNSGLKYEWKRLAGSVGQGPLIKTLFRRLPRLIQAAAHLLRYTIERWPLRGKREGLSSDFSADVTFVDYLVHLNQDAMTRGRYKTNYWTDIVDVLNKNEFRVNWLHHYVPHDALSSAQQAQNLISRFNEYDIQRHLCFDSALSMSIIMSTLLDFCRIVSKGLRLRNVRNKFRLEGSKIDLWPLFKDDWFDSLYGATAIMNCMCLNLIERILKDLPYQKLGVYLQENQGWEMAFIHAWRAAGHGKLVGAPHATMRFWDLRYFFDASTYHSNGENRLPMPDLVALNGPASACACRQGGFPMERTVEVEALRYLYLADLNIEARTDKRQSSDQLRVLVLGDYVSAVTRRQMQLLVDTATSLPSNIQFIVKPHPTSTMKASDYPSLPLVVTDAPMAELLSECDVAFTGHITSAAVDAYVSGLPVVSMLDGEMFNMSPLRDLTGVVFVSNPDELALAFRKVVAREWNAARAYFCIDKQLSRWRRLLGMHKCASE